MTDTPSEDTLNTIVKLINLYDDGKHVIATRGVLQWFEAGYINDCLKRALAAGRLSEDDMATAKRWLNPSWEPLKKPKTLLFY